MKKARHLDEMRTSRLKPAFERT